MRKYITWNVNGLRAALKKGFLDFCAAEGADAFCVQETKMQKGQAEVALPGYAEFWNSAVRKGYSGTAVFSRLAPLNASFGIDNEVHESEGRSITLEFDEFYLVTEYTPNAQDGLARISYRLEWEDSRRAYLRTLDAKKPVILCGDLNVAHNEIDLKNPKSNRGSAGFSDQEGLSSGNCWTRVSRTASAFSTRTGRALIRSGPSAPMPALIMQAGA